MKIILLGLEFNNGNKGCEALSYSFIELMERVLKDKGIQAEYISYVYDEKPDVYVLGTDRQVILRKIKYKDINMWKTFKKDLDECAFAIDFTQGDSFTDIYGFRRYFFPSLMKKVAVKSKALFVLGPQTYGPFSNGLIRQHAKKIIAKSDYVFSRDQQSTDMVTKLCGKEVHTVTDVAFALPYEKKRFENVSGKIVIGINPSGLLWKGGYTGDNQFGLTVDYQKYCRELLKRLDDTSKYEVYLIPHVGCNPSGAMENDADVCEALSKEFPYVKNLFGIRSVIDIKGYIAACDVFIGARMHATIGAFSSGVATIPFSYSRKFEGLYNSLGYDYTIGARHISTDEALEKTMDYIARYEDLKQAVNEGMNVVKQEENHFLDVLSKIVDSQVK